VRVKLYERTPEAFVEHNGEMMGVDFDDKPFPLRGFMGGMKIPVIAGKTEDERKNIVKFIGVFKNVCGDFFDNIAEIKYSNSGDIVFKTYAATVIYWGDERAEHMRHKFDKLQKIYADAVTKHKEIEYLDMTYYGLGKAIVKPRNDAEDGGE
jgi:cell division protein FtsQ